MNTTWHHLPRWLLAGLLALLVAACDPQNISELEEGLSTEADVRERFGAPEAVWDGPDGAQVYEYNRQPAGHTNYMITIGPDGKMTALRQVLNPRTFAQVQPGMMMEDVRRMLGKPTETERFPLKREEVLSWRFSSEYNRPDMFNVHFDPDGRVVTTSVTAAKDGSEVGR